MAPAPRAVDFISYLAGIGKAWEVLPKLHPAVTPLATWVKVLPKLVEWKSPTSVLTHTSPATIGWTRIWFTVVEEPRVAVFVNVTPTFEET